MARAARQERLAELHRLIADMELPEARKSATEDFDLRWIGRNMAIRNLRHPNFEAAVAALRALGVDMVLQR